LHCLLLDMYSKKPLYKLLYKEGNDLLLKCPYFDPEGYTKIRKYYSRWVDFIFRGGVRKRIFGIDVWLSKYPLVKFKKSLFLIWGAHVVENSSIANIQGVLLHFKFISDINKRMIDCSEWVNHWNKNKKLTGYAKQCKIYANKIKENRNLNFYYSKSVRFKNNKQLVNLELMKTSKSLDSYVKNCLK